MLDVFLPTFNFRWVARLTRVSEDDVAEAVAHLQNNGVSTQWSHRYCMVAALSRSAIPAIFMDAGMDIDSAHVAAHALTDAALGATFLDTRLSLTLIKEACDAESEAVALTALSVHALHAVEAQLSQALSVFKEYFFEENMALPTALSIMQDFMTTPLSKPLDVATDAFRDAAVAEAVVSALSARV